MREIRLFWQKSFSITKSSCGAPILAGSDERSDNRHHQIRGDLYIEVEKAADEHEADGGNDGQRVILHRLPFQEVAGPVMGGIAGVPEQTKAPPCAKEAQFRRHKDVALAGNEKKHTNDEDKEVIGKTAPAQLEPAALIFAAFARRQFVPEING